MIFSCTTSGTGQLIWKVNDLTAGVFNSPSDDVDATSEILQGVTATLTAEDETVLTLSSSLRISSAGVDVENGAQISCSDDSITGSIETTELFVTCEFAS